MPTSGKIYFIINKKANTVIDLSAVDQKSVTGYPLLKGDNQKWKAVQVSERHGNFWTLQNVWDGRYLDFETSDPKDDTNVIGVETKDPRKWDIKPDEKDASAWRIVVMGSSLNVDLADKGNPKTGTRVTLWSSHLGENQVWKFQEV